MKRFFILGFLGLLSGLWGCAEVESFLDPTPVQFRGGPTLPLTAARVLFLDERAAQPPNPDNVYPELLVKVEAGVENWATYRLQPTLPPEGENSTEAAAGEGDTVRVRLVSLVVTRENYRTDQTPAAFLRNELKALLEGTLEIVLEWQPADGGLKTSRITVKSQTSIHEDDDAQTIQDRYHNFSVQMTNLFDREATKILQTNPTFEGLIQN